MFPYRNQVLCSCDLTVPPPLPAEEVLAGAQVVAATCVGAADPRMAGRKFRMVVLDEATQARRVAGFGARGNSL